MLWRNENSATGEASAQGVLVHLNTPFRQRTKASRQSAIMQRFAETRRGRDDVFWLKENAEILNVFEATGAMPDDYGLSVYDVFYDDLEARIGFFPQYYRFFLALSLDLEDLGMPGVKGERLTHWVAHTGLIGAELSDLQRAEARRLCLRRGVDPLPGDTGLEDRLRTFTSRSDTFALPNKKAAYELTHILFYLSEYGRTDPGVEQDTLNSLFYAGTLAFLELNIDLLSEICIALRFAGHEPPPIWENWLRDQVRRFVISVGSGPARQDDYHPWLMLNWSMEVSGAGGFGQDMPEGSVIFSAPQAPAGPLRELSDSIYRLGDRRSDNWAELRDDVGDAMSDDARSVLEAAEGAVDFEAFFRGFSRAVQPGDMI